METLDGTQREFFKKCLRQKCMQKKCPLLAAQTAGFFVAFTRFQTWHKDKISLFSFNIFYFFFRLLKTETDIGESIANVFLLLALAQARFPQFTKY